MVHPHGSSRKRLGSDAPPPRPCARGCGRGKGCRVGGGRCAPTCAQRGGRWPQEESCARSAHSAAAVCLGRCHRGQGRERLRTRQSASAWLRPVHRALGGGQEASSSRLRWLGAGPKACLARQGLPEFTSPKKEFYNQKLRKPLLLQRMWVWFLRAYTQTFEFLSRKVSEFNLNYDSESCDEQAKF